MGDIGGIILNILLPKTKPFIAGIIYKQYQLLW